MNTVCPVVLIVIFMLLCYQDGRSDGRAISPLRNAPLAFTVSGVSGFDLAASTPPTVL